MSAAFGGDPALKADLLARLAFHAEKGTLHFGATRWDGEQGSPQGVSAESEDSGDYAVRFGYPLALAALLDPLMAHARPDRAVEETLHWVRCVQPGADLSSVPARIADDLLVRLGADRHAAGHYHDLRALHLAEASDTDVARRDWSELRQVIERAAEAAKADSEVATPLTTALTALAAACWPLLNSRSVLTVLMDMWLHNGAGQFDADFSVADNAEAMAMLNAIYAETQPQRDADQFVDIPAIFRERAPALSSSFEANLERNNRRLAERQHQLPGMVLDHLAAASSAPNS